MTMKSHISFWEIVAKYLDIHPKSLETARKRYSQGEQFFTKSLPSLGKDLESGLTGRFILSPSTPFGAKKGTALPLFLNELFRNIFFDDGFIRPNPVGIAELRFLCKMLYKFETPMSPLMVDEAIVKFKDIDSAVKTEKYPFGLSEVRKHFVSLFPDFPRDIRPHHASGATSLRFSNTEKRFVRHRIDRLDQYFDSTFFFNSIRHASNWCAVNKTTKTPGYPRVTFVPKDSRGPRTICIFHHMDMFIQKGLQEKLYDFTERGYSPAKGYINFSDQRINQRLAYLGSIDGCLATIDLKDASDLVPWNLVKLLCPAEWYEALASTRSDVVKVNGQAFDIKKYAAMGSALCFPIEAFVFWSIAKTVSPYAYVYGDDIIVPNDKAYDVIAALESYGLQVNHGKTLTQGLFRESCGGDYYGGLNINYPSCKSYDPAKYIAFCNEVTQLISSDLSDKLICNFEFLFNKQVYREPLVFSSEPEPYIFYTDRTSSSSVFFKRRWNEDLHFLEVLREHIKARPVKSKTSMRKRPIGRDTFECIDDDLLFDWYTTVDSTVAPKEEAYYAKIGASLVHTGRRMSPLSEKKNSVKRFIDLNLIKEDILLRQDSSPETKYEWGYLKRV